MSTAKVMGLIQAEERRHVAAIMDLIAKHPEYRLHLAYALLGGAIAVADSLGIDVAAFLAELRRREPMPPVLAPPQETQS